MGYSIGVLNWVILKINELTKYSVHPDVFLGKGVLKICSKFTGEHSVKLLCNFTEITVRHGCSPVNLLDVFRTSFT